MSSEKADQKPSRKGKSLDEEIAAAADKLRKLQERQREQQRKERDRSQRAVLDIIRAERLDTVSPDVWRTAMPKIKAILMPEVVQPTEPAKPAKAAAKGATADGASQ